MSIPLRIAAGERGGLFHSFATMLAAEIVATQPRLRPVVVETAASQQNLRMLRTSTADLALTLLDSATAGDLHWLRALGRTYEDYLQLVVAAGSRIRTVANLAGGRISLGADGSGAAFTGRRLLAAAGLRDDQLTVRHFPLVRAAAALGSGEIDALLWSGGVPTPALSDLARRLPIRLVDLSAVRIGLQTRFPDLYHTAIAPAGVYGQPVAVPTVGIATLLTCRVGLDRSIAAAVTQVLVSRAASLVPAEVVGTQYLDTPALLATGAVPLHPGAVDAYRSVHQ